MRRDWVALALVAAGATAEITPSSFELVGDAEAAAAPSRLDVPYDRVVQKTVHNAYARREPLFDQLAWHGVRSLELDVHTTRAGVSAARQDWFVFHEDVPLARGSSCATLRACLGQLAAFHRAVPGHDVVTLFVDVKDGFPEGHAPADLDAVLAEGLGRDALVTPEDLLARCPGARSIRDAVAGTCKFPSGRELRGKFVVAITGGTACAPSSAVSVYARSGTARARTAFVASNSDASCPVEGFDDARFDHVAFVNLSFDERTRAPQVRTRGLVARVYYGGLVGGLDTEGDFFEARRSGAQLLATDAVNAEVDRWSLPSPASSPSWNGPAVHDAEPGDFALVEATTGALGGDHDSFFYAFERSEGRESETWSSILSVPSSHVEPLAHACLMARAAEGDDAAYAAVCRPFDEGAPRLLVRARRGGPTTVRELELPADAATTPESAAFFRFHVEPAVVLSRGLRATHVVAESSTDGVTWAAVGAASVAGDLPMRGVAVASQDRTPVRALVGHLLRQRGDEATPIRVADLRERVAIGTRASGRLLASRR